MTGLGGRVTDRPDKTDLAVRNMADVRLLLVEHGLADQVNGLVTYALEGTSRMSMTHKVASSPEAMHQVTGLINLAGACGWDTHFEATFHPAQTFPSKPDEVMLPAHIIYRVLGRRGLETLDAMWAAWDTHPDGAQAHVRFLGGTHYTPDGGDVAFPHYGDLRAHLRQTSGIRPSVVAEQFSDDGLLDALTHAPDGPWQDELKTEALRRMKRSTQ